MSRFRKWTMKMEAFCFLLFYHGKKLKGTTLELQKSYDELEHRADERTKQMSETNALLNREINERKQALKALRESEIKYKSLFENINCGVAVYEACSDGEDFIFQDFNKAGQHIEQTPLEKAIGRKVSEVFPGVKDFGLFETFQRVWKTGKPEHHPVTLYKDQRVCGWRDNFVYKLPSGQIVAVYTDETERMQALEILEESEERYRALFENMIVGYAYCKIIADHNHLPVDFMILAVNDMFQRLTGLKREKILGKKATDITPTIRRDHPELFENYGKTLMKGDNVQFDIYLKPFSMWLSISAYSPQQDHFAMMFENITDRKKAEEDLRTANEKQMIAHKQRKILSKRLIDLLEKDRRQIAMELHDHIGQSLTSLKINLEMLHHQTNPNQITLRSQIGKAEEKAVQILKDIKDISRGLRPSVLDALGLVSSLRELFNQIQEQTEIDIHFFNQGIPKRMAEDKELTIYRIAQEAFSNIIKHAQAKTVYVNLVRTNSHISLGIEDDGVGFDKDEAMTTSNAKGSLGLLIMQERAKQLDGEFTIESRRGYGTHLLTEIPI